MSNGSGQMMFIEGRWVDKASAEFQKTMGKMKGEAKRAGKQMGSMVSEDTGRRLSQFNEKTEKMRQVLMLSGNAAGTAAGQITYYAGTLSYLVGRLGPVEWALMAVGAALAAVGFAFRQVSKEQEEHLKTLDDYHKRLQKINAEMERTTQVMLSGSQQQAMVDLAYADYQAAEYLEQAAKKEWEARKAHFKETREGLQEVLDARTRYQEAHRRAVEAEALTEAAALKRDAVYEARQKQEKKAAKERAAAGGAGGGFNVNDWFTGGGGGVAAFGAMGIDLGVMEAMGQARLAVHQAWQDDIVRQAQTAEEMQTEIAWENALRREQIYENESRAAEKKIQHQMAMVENTIGVFGELGDVLTKGTKANTAARIAAIVMEAAWDAAKYGYKAVAAFAAGQPWAGAEYLTAAAMAAAVAAGKVQGAASGGGGGSSISSRDSAQGGWRDQQQTKEKGELRVTVWLGNKHIEDAVAEAVQANADREDPGRKRTKVV